MLPVDWNHLRAFLATVETGSLSGAARRLGLTQPTLSRQITAMESALDVVLFERIGKRLHLTSAGHQLAAHARDMGSAAERFSLAASGQSSAIEGTVRITAIDVLAAYTLPPIVETIKAEAPGIVIEVIASNALDDLMRREADIAIRHVEPVQPDLIARRCSDSRAGLYAASRLIDTIGRPARPQDIVRLPFIGFPDMSPLVTEFNARGLALRDEDVRWRCASSLINLQLIIAGYGYGIALEEALPHASGVELLLPEMDPILAPMWLVAHRELHTSPKIRIVYDALYTGLARRHGR